MKSDYSAQKRPQHLSASLDWDEQGLPVSSQFGDVYFSKASGIAETRYVFLLHNRLKQRFEALVSGQTFTIAETGFGTGLNFLCAWQLFDEVAPDNCQLHFISTEKFPLTNEDMARALKLFPELRPFSEELCRHYQFPEKKQLTRLLADGKVRLTLLIGDVLDTLPGVEENIDAWFLDGFAPAKNPQMWQPSLFLTMATKSANEATYATFTAARMVREGLNSAGFTINRHPGYGAKREMISGQFLPELLSEKMSMSETSPWFRPRKHNNREKSAIVIGGGLAGTSVAYALATRGWQVEIIEQHDQLASEASGNVRGMLYAKLSPNNTPLSQFVLDGYHHTLGLLETLRVKEWNPCGLIQLALTEKLAERYQALDRQHPDSLLKYLCREQLSGIAGIPVKSAGLFFPHAGWVSPPAFCEAMSSHPNIKVTTGCKTDQLKQTTEGWQLFSGDEMIASTKTVIIAKGTASNEFPQLQHLPLKAIRGQVSHVLATEASSKLATCVCGEGYIAPASDGHHSVGATFNLKDDNKELSNKDHRKNLGLQSYSFPAMYAAMGEKNALITGGRVGFRATTPDYLPVVGGVVDYESFTEQFTPLKKNRKHRFSDYAKYLDGLYVSSGHGSRGLLSCPLSGEILAAMINNEPLPVDDELLFHLNPTRFLVRDLARNKI